MSLKIYDLQIDEWNEAEFARHGVTGREVRQVLDESPSFRPNKKQHAARVMMIGPTAAGRFLTVPLAETAVEGIWRPATAWESTAGELAHYRPDRSRQ